MGLILLLIQIPYVFWLEHLSHLHLLAITFIDRYVFNAILFVRLFSSVSFFLHFSFSSPKASPLIFAAVLVWY